MVACICGEDLADTDDACPACGMPASAARAAGRAASDSSPSSEAGKQEAPPELADDYRWPNFCGNCFGRFEGTHALADREQPMHCPECRSLIDLIDAAHADLRDRRHESQRHWEERHDTVPLPERDGMTLSEIRAEMDAEAHAAGYLPQPKPLAAWAAARHPELAWLACLTTPAIDVHLLPLSRRILAERFPDVKPIAWEALLRI